MSYLLEDYCQLCGKTNGSVACCQSMESKEFASHFLPAPMFSVRMLRDSKVIKINEYSFINLQLQVALKTIKPFWFLNLENEWEECRPDGILRTYPYSEGYVSEGPFDKSALGLTSKLVIKILQAQKSE